MSPVKLGPSKGWPERWKVQGDTDEYTVGRRDNGTMGCTCKRWIFHPKPKPNCKHIRIFLAAESIAPKLTALGGDRVFRDSLSKRERVIVQPGPSLIMADPEPTTVEVQDENGQKWKVSRVFRDEDDLK